MDFHYKPFTKTTAGALNHITKRTEGIADKNVVFMTLCEALSDSELSFLRVGNSETTINHRVGPAEYPIRHIISSPIQSERR